MLKTGFGSEAVKYQLFSLCWNAVFDALIWRCLGPDLTSKCKLFSLRWNPIYCSKNKQKQSKTGVGFTTIWPICWVSFWRQKRPRKTSFWEVQFWAKKFIALPTIPVSRGILNTLTPEIPYTWTPCGCLDCDTWRCRKMEGHPSWKWRL